MPFGACLTDVSAGGLGCKCFLPSFGYGSAHVPRGVLPPVPWTPNQHTSRPGTMLTLPSWAVHTCLLKWHLNLGTSFLKTL